jgi:PhnB protein
MPTTIEFVELGTGDQRMAKVKYNAPKGYGDATAYLRVGNAQVAIDFYGAAFGAKERYRLTMGDRIGHAELEFGNTCVMLSDEFPEMGIVGPKALCGTTVTMCLGVADADAVVARAVAAGATLKRPVQDEFYGFRTGQVEDPFGHVWMIQTQLEDISPKKMQKRLDAMMAGATGENPHSEPKSKSKSKSKPKPKSKPARGREKS